MNAGVCAILGEVRRQYDATKIDDNINIFEGNEVLLQ